MIKIDNNNKKNCCGCTACYSICTKSCISMAEDAEGFKYPVVNTELCINCSMCEKVCPMNKEKPADFLTEAYVTRNRDMNVVMSSTSGGAFSALTGTAFDEHAVVFGCTFDDGFNIIHDHAETFEEAAKFRNSKYVQSDMRNSFKEVKELLDSNQFVLFSGSPCQCAGLRSYLGKDYANLVLVDFVCHSIPSPLVWRRYREYVVSRYSSGIKGANFRSKAFGYHCSSMQVDLENGRSLKRGISTDLFMKSFFKDVSCRPSCYDCPFKTVDRYSDITLFDCWDITRYAPKVKDDNKGYTAVILHSQKGKALFERARKQLYVYDADLETLINADGKFAVKSIDKSPLREQFFQLLSAGLPIDQVVSKTIPVSTHKKIMNSLKSILYRTHLLEFTQKMKTSRQ